MLDVKMAQRSRVSAICESPDFQNDKPEFRDELVFPLDGERSISCEHGKVRSERRRFQKRSESGRRIGQRERGALLAPLRRPPPSGPSAQIKKYAAAQRTLRRYVANDEAVMGCGSDRPIEHELDVGRFSRSDRLVVEQDDARADFRRGMMQSDWEPLTDRLFLSRQDSHARVDAIGRRVQLGIERHVAASDRVFGYVRAGEIERAAVARIRPTSAWRFCA